MINGENFFDQPIKNNKITYDNIRKIAIGQGDDYITGCLLDYPYFADTEQFNKLILLEIYIELEIQGFTLFLKKQNKLF